MIKKTSNNAARVTRHSKILKRVKGNDLRPRLCIYRSLKHFFVQIINDKEDKVLYGIGTVSKQFKEKSSKLGVNKGNAAILGKIIAEECLKKGIKQVVFDRNGFKYHGRIEALADAAREAGLSF